MSLDFTKDKSTLVQVMAGCCQAPDPVFDPDLCPISEDLGHSPKSNYAVITNATIMHNEFENYILNITSKFARNKGIKYDVYNET